MQIKKLKLENFRGIQEIEIELLPNINVFVGINGSGKSTILDAIAISLSWLVNRIQRAEAKGRIIPDESIKNETNYSSMIINILENNQIYNWKNIEFSRGYPKQERSNLLNVSELASFYQKEFQKENKLPMIAYYPINRVAKGISPRITGRESISQFDVYDNALGSKANFQAFFEWFRLQDDIVNEQSQSKNIWMRQHKSWIESKLNKILNILGDKRIINRFKRKLERDSFLLEEPQYLFFELVEFIQYPNSHNRSTSKNLHEIEYLFHRMSRLLSRVKDENIEKNNVYFHEAERIFQNISSFVENDNILHFIWEIFLFFTELYFWRISPRGKEDIEEIFKNFNPSEKKRHFKFIIFKTEIQKVLDNDKRRLNQAISNQGKELQIVTQTIEKFIPEYSNLRVKRSPIPHMLVEKNGETIRLDQLSDGEKNMIAMVGDIARRLSMANPNLPNPLEGEGIVMIDEVDLHLHPSWQRVIVSKLIEVFPNIQFIVTTHSPQVLSHIKADHIFILQQESDNISVTKPTESYGKSSDRQLEDILGVEARPLEIKEELHRLFKLIRENSLDEAKEIMNELENKIEGREPELVKANVLIKRKEILGK